MKIFVRVKPNSKKESVKKVDAVHFEVSTRFPPHEGKANASAINSIAKYFGIPKSRVRIVSGIRHRQKIFDIF